MPKIEVGSWVWTKTDKEKAWVVTHVYGISGTIEIARFDDYKRRSSLVYPVELELVDAE